LNWERDRFSVGLTGKVALGVTRETVNIYGNSSQSGPGAFAPGSFNGGLYTQASNIGQQTKNFASSISSVEAKLGYRITPQIRATLGYDYLFWSNVARATNQFDRNINPNQSAILGNGVIVAADPAQPAPQMNQSNFSVHGVSFGLEFRY